MALDTDELEPRPPTLAPRDLEIMSVEGLRDYIGELEGEIARVHEVIARKEQARQGAESFFRKK
ncbi:DUF1192 domain-containing protein [Caenispirillum bisanense]|uniref:DUF1192 domain-containing protein n=1 Tax=Caenispirillum bisanense TaxID=414052 RepID=A0A286GQ71_9PROT|nr:DUF1192 domain-containing protein [Caenispirillum bisanense]SOD97695.1 Protein of unknown function [Caenispirillum bisanense]